MPERPTPAAFIGHGAVRITFEKSSVTDGWRAFSAAVPRPRAIVMISAHFYTNVSVVTAMDPPPTIHDHGYPELYDFRYPAPGDPELAARIVELAKPTPVGLDEGQWGLDHGAWSVLNHLYPEADVPVVELSVDATKSYDYHVGLGAKLAPLRDEGVLVIASGSLLHGGRPLVRDGQRTEDYFRALHFIEDVAELVRSHPGDAAGLRDHPDFEPAAGHDDHFLPFLYFAGLAAAGNDRVELMVDGLAEDRPGATAFSLGMSHVLAPMAASADRA